jgi:hypothetical protein
LGPVPIYAFAFMNRQRQSTACARKVVSIRLDLIVIELRKRTMRGPDEYSPAVFFALVSSFGRLIDLKMRLMTSSRRSQRTDVPTDVISLKTLSTTQSLLSLSELTEMLGERRTELERSSLRTAGSAYSNSGIQARRDQTAVRLRRAGWTLGAIANAMGVVNRSVAAKMVDRGARVAMDESVLPLVAEEQEVLRRSEVNLLNQLLFGDLDARTFISKVNAYLRVSKDPTRCKLLGLFHASKRELRPALPGHDSDDVKVEVAETMLTIARWRAKSGLEPAKFEESLVT